MCFVHTRKLKGIHSYGMHCCYCRSVSRVSKRCTLVMFMCMQLLTTPRVVFSYFFAVNYSVCVSFSDGVGRTGTFITIDYSLEQREREGVVDIAGVIRNLRQQRTQMVQTVV